MDGGKPTMKELQAHAATIGEILEIASERVDRLAADAGTPALVDAIRQELSLSRRWNQHLGTILLDVAEARRALGEREREAAKEITRMTAAAEEARLELLALKKMLKRHPDKAVQNLEERSDDMRGGGARTGAGSQTASSKPAVDASVEAFREPRDDLRDMRAALASVQEAQKSAARDVDAVRIKIMDALQTLATVRGDLPLKLHPAGADLSSEDITAWAASMATRLHRTPKTVAE
ncbi:MAG: hypothetical protein ACR2P3_10705 [Geminicoccaceae bacterium]